MRHKAELLVKARESGRPDSKNAAANLDGPIMHELLVHQIELELQNEALRIAQTQADEARARYFELYELAPVGYMVLSPTGIILETNITGAGILGLSKQDILGRPFTRFVSRDDQDAYYLRNRRLFATLDPQVLEVRVVRADQQTRWVQLTETASESAEGLVCRLVMSDITERKVAEEKICLAEERALALVEKLQRADQNKNKFLNILSHELRNPLAAITMGLSLQEMVQPGSEAAAKAAEVLKRQTAQLTHLVDDLLDVTRITQNKITLKKKPVNFVELVQRVVTDFQSSFADKGVALAVYWPDEPIQLDADPVRLIQAIGNLLHNALKFTDAGGNVTVSLSTTTCSGHPGEAVLHVTDTGAGMTRELQKELFQPFIQADNSLNRLMGGLGLGLSVVKGMIEMHGGRVEAVSEGLGKGSRFSIHLPLHLAQPEGLPPGPVKHAEKSRPLRILLIEDNLDLMQLLTELLNLLGHETATAGNGSDGIALAAVYHTDVVMCDIGLPGMSGYEVARSLSASSGRIERRPCLIAMSGYAQPEDVARSRAAGFDLHMAKPVDMAILEQYLMEVSDR